MPRAAPNSNNTFLTNFDGRPNDDSSHSSDLTCDPHQINSHFDSAAYPVLEAAGLLRQTRVRSKQKKSSR